MARPSKLTPSEIKRALPKVRGWRRRGQALHRTFTFKDFAAAMQFTNQVARLAEKADHHPDIDIRWNEVTLVWSTHSAGGLTEYDFTLAAQVSALLK